MKKMLVLFFAVLLLASCSSPVLKWIDTSERGDVNIAGDAGSQTGSVPAGGDDGRTTGSSGAKEILSFAFGLAGETDLPIGQNPDSTGKIPISIILPMGTPGISALRPTVKFIGKSLDPPSLAARNFSSPVDYTVTAEDGSTRGYTATVYVKSDSSKDIVYFALDVGSLSAVGIINQTDHTVVVTVPAGTSLGALTAHVAHTGASVEDPAGNVHPGETFTVNGDFSAPKTWTVSAADGTTEPYLVTVIREKSSAKEITRFSLGVTGENVIIGAEPQPDGRYPILVVIPQAAAPTTVAPPTLVITGESISPDRTSSRDFSKPVTYTVIAEDRSTRDYVVTVIPNALDSRKQITGFYFTDPMAVGDIDEVHHTIKLWVPEGTDLSAIRPEIYYTGVSISPLSGQAMNFTGSDVGPETYTVRAQDGSSQAYAVSVFLTPSPPVVPPPPAPGTDPQIDAFYFTDPVAIGNINQSTGAISVTVPYGTNIQNLAPVIYYTGKEIAGIPGPSGLTANRTSFVNPVNYTVVAQLGPPPSKTYTVTVTVAPNTAKEITAFSFTGVTPTSTIISAAPNAAGKYPIEVTVPAGTLLTSLDTSITYTGSSIKPLPAGISATAKPFTESTKDFSGADINATPPVIPVDYEVTAADGSTKTYAVTVRIAATDDDEKEITGFYFTTPLAVGTVNQNANTITVTVPSGTAVASLTPTVFFKGMSLNPGSGTAKNFSGPVVYTVTARNGSARSYTVTVKVTPSGAKEITKFSFPGIISPDTVIGAVQDAGGTYPISVWVPSGTALGSLAPVITHTGKSISPAAGTVLNFYTPQNYTVTAEDGTTKTYRVTVIPSDVDARIITSFIFDEVPLSGGGSVRAVGSIDQASHTIKVDVPSTANVTNLTPVLTYIGKSVTPPGGAAQTANPFTDSVQNFTGAQIYTVNPQSGAGQAYTVTVTRRTAVNVTFEGEVERTVIASNTYNQSTGIITVTANATAPAAPLGIDNDKPIEWYVDGVKQAVSGATFTLNVGNGSFTPGRHEIMVSGRKNGLHYTGKVYFTVSG